MQQPQNDKTNPLAESADALTYVINRVSGWEADDDLAWIIDEANAAEWENQVAYILDR